MLFNRDFSITRYWACRKDMPRYSEAFYFNTKEERDEYLADSDGIDKFDVWNETIVYDPSLDF